MMEEHLAQAVMTDTELSDLAYLADRDPADWFYLTSSLGQPGVAADPVKPWIAMNELAAIPHSEVKKTSDAQTRSFQFFVYDDKGDFARINEILAVLRRITKEMAPFITDQGTRCSDSEWFGISGNLPADAYSGVCRFGTARFVVSQ